MNLNNKPIKELKKIADDLFRKYVHASHPEKWTCPTCDTRMENKLFQVGHAFRRNETAVRYHKKAATLQCQICNYDCEDLKPFMIDLYGPEWEDEMIAARQQDIRRWDLIEIIENLKS